MDNNIKCKKTSESRKKQVRDYQRKRRGKNIKYQIICAPELGLLIKAKFFEKKNEIVFSVTSGRNHSKGYKAMVYNKKQVYVHRFIWEYVNGVIRKGMTIDHINHNKKDNSIKNLRIVSNAENHKNMPLNARNKSGQSGVYFQQGKKKWVAQININKKTVCLGSFSDINEAINARKESEKVHNYHKNHGLRDIIL